LNTFVKPYSLAPVILLVVICSSFGHIRDPKFEQISMDRGLSHPAVSCVLQDSDGFMWFGTEDGLDRFDGYSFFIFRNSPNDTTSLAHNWISCVCESDAYSLWVGTKGGGLCKFNKNEGTFTRFVHERGARGSFPDSVINAILYDDNNSLWIGTTEGLSRLNIKSMLFETILFDKTNPEFSPSVISLAQDHHKDIWVGTAGRGLFKIHHEMIKEVKHYYFEHKDTSPLLANTINTIYKDRDNKIWAGTEGLGIIHIDWRADDFTIYQNRHAVQLGEGANKIRDIMEDQTGTFWIATAGAGINTFDRQNGEFHPHKCSENTVCCLGNNIIHAVACDKTGIIWLATDCCGVNKFVPERMEIAYRDSDLRSPNKLSQNRVWSFLEDSYGVLWIATSDGLKQLLKDSDTFKHHSSDPADASTLSNNAVTIIFEDSRKQLWIGTEDGLNLYNRQERIFKRFHFDPNNLGSLSDNGIVAIEEDHLGNLWVGTRLGGLNRYNPQSNNFERMDHDPNNMSSMSNSSIMTILESSSHKSLWIGTFNGGLVEYEFASQKFNHFLHEHGDLNSISHNTVYSIYEDEQAVLWIGTNGGGLNKFVSQTRKNTTYSETDGLLSNQILNIIGDNSQNIWISTSKGLCVFDPSEERFVTFHLADDLHSNLFDRGAFYKNKHGDFYYGTAEGIHKFNPDSLDFDYLQPSIVLTGLKVNNISIMPYLGANSLKKLNLRYDQNYFTFEFAVLDYRNPAANKYKFCLSGVDDSWIDARHDRTIKYSNMQPGHYTLEVKGRNADGIGAQNSFSLPIRITPPPWKTWWAYVLYFIAITGIILIFWQTTLKRERLKNQLKFERFQGERLQELDQLKSRFFANISHEFRSPLTLIVGPLERITEKIKNNEVRDDINMMKKNAGKLLKLINQLLDLSRLESGKMLLRVKEQNIITFLKETLLSFSALAESKSISLSFMSDDDDVKLHFDAEVMDKIMTNLVANAVKFTPPNGIVTVSVIHSKKTPRSSLMNGRLYDKNWGAWVQIAVSDTGPGIPAEKIDKIFDHFYQYTGQRNDGENIGSGIGLALVKELVELHKGRIVVSSKIRVGTNFTITLPGGRAQYAAHEVDDFQTAKATEQHPIEHENKQKSRFTIEDLGDLISNDALPCILVVDDNKDIRTYIRKTLTDRYNIIETSNGLEGWNSAIEEIPDLIISDVMMPEMDGIKLCNKLKSDERTNHIPVILLTVRAAEEDKIEGLQFGADEYMTKPFDANELLARVNNLITQRQRLCEYYNKSLSLNEIATKDIDHQFLQRAIRIVEKHLADPDFSVAGFCHELGISRPQLHRKMTALTNQSTSKFIRTIRLKHAASMLATRSGNVFEVAQDVGFNNLSYFAKCFHEQYDMSPSEYLSKSPKTP
jgi:signal transduction histidine kinase/ligand-binding sensor domain-containing protein/DNA-binding response OmpR family regulator